MSYYLPWTEKNQKKEQIQGSPEGKKGDYIIDNMG